MEDKGLTWLREPPLEGRTLFAELSSCPMCPPIAVMSVAGEDRLGGGTWKGSGPHDIPQLVRESRSRGTSHKASPTAWLMRVQRYLSGRRPPGLTRCVLSLWDLAGEFQRAMWGQASVGLEAAQLGPEDFD